MAFDILSLVIFLVVGFIAGWLADLIVKDVSFGLWGHIIIGLIGALIGGFLFGLLGIGGGNIIWSILSALSGAIILLVIIKAIK
jgi:uncharacterized membrane protein YeaQ/YmgE (transglycosylase-associated protein family)